MKFMVSGIPRATTVIISGTVNNPLMLSVSLQPLKLTWGSESALGMISQVILPAQQVNLLRQLHFHNNPNQSLSEEAGVCASDTHSPLK